MARLPRPTGGLTGSYYNDPTGSRSFVGKTPVIVRRDPTVGFRWNEAGPGPGVGTDNFLVRWTGWITMPTTASYTFYTANDDGIRVWIGGALIIDRWFDQSSEPVLAAPMTLTAGQRRTVTIEYYEHLGPANVSRHGIPSLSRFPVT